ncbi:NUDIX domain-containing protein [Streptomyces anulatus]|uniref:NUDIX domain-containing protein n=1 Tax=Streptomyces anulatus TaxID=1892 RepID=UPI0036DA7283
MLLSEQGILLDRRRLGTLELPGGRVEAGDCIKDAVVRELTEQAGLVTRAEDAVLLGTLVDHVAGVLRVTVGAGRPHLAGQPTMQPNESVGDWSWFPLDRLPDGLFVCSAQILTAWRPDLPIEREIIGVRNFIINPAVTKEQREHQYNKCMSPLSRRVPKPLTSAPLHRAPQPEACMSCVPHKHVGDSGAGPQCRRTVEHPPPKHLHRPGSAPRATASRTRTSRVTPA